MTTQLPENKQPDARESNETSKLPDEQQQREIEDEDRKLDEAIEMTFPASDPLAI